MSRSEIQLLNKRKGVGFISYAQRGIWAIKVDSTDKVIAELETETGAKTFVRLRYHSHRCRAAHSSTKSYYGAYINVMIGKQPSVIARSWDAADGAGE
jgi:hypothetical protein